MQQQVQQTQPNQQVPPVQPSKPAAPKTRKPRARQIDFLFIAAVIGAVCQACFIWLLLKEKANYEALRKQDEDRIYIVQKATTVSQDDIERLDAAFLSDQEVVTFIQSLEETRPNFDMFTMQFTSDVPQGKDPQYLSFVVRTSGQKERVLSFIDKLLHTTHAIEATEVTLTVDEQDRTKLVLMLGANLYVAQTK